MTAYVHESSAVDEGAHIGDGTKIWHFCHVMRGARIGENCSFGQNVFVASNVIVGDNVKVQNNVSIYEGVVVDDDVFLGPSMVFTNVKTPRSHVDRRAEYSPTHVGRGASVGANATIVCGVKLGPYSFVGAGAVVTRDVPAYGVVYGVPAELRSWACQCGEGLSIQSGETARCLICAKSYELKGSNLRPLTQG